MNRNHWFGSRLCLLLVFNLLATTSASYAQIAPPFTTLYSFSGPDGSQPNGRLLLSSDGNFYGTTDGGGGYGAGTLFRLSASGELTTLYSFSGSSPASGLAQGADGTLYGVTGGGGVACERLRLTL